MVKIMRPLEDTTTGAGSKPRAPPTPEGEASAVKHCRPDVHVHAQMNMNNEHQPRRRKVWTAQDDEDLRYWHAFRYTDGKIARKLGCCRRTVLRQREAMDLCAVNHPNSKGHRAGRTRCQAVASCD